MGRLILREFGKLRRNRLPLFLGLAAVLFPLYGTLTAAVDSQTTEAVYGSTIGTLVVFGLPFLLPFVTGLLAARLFYLESECDTLKLLRTVPVDTAALTAAKLIALLCLVEIITALAALGCLAGALAISRTLPPVAARLFWLALAEGILQAITALPLVFLMVLIRGSSLLCLLIGMLYSVLNGFSGLQVLMRLDAAGLPASPGQLPWPQQVLFGLPGSLIQRCFFAGESPAPAAYGVSPAALAAVMAGMLLVCGAGITWAYNRWER